VVAGEGGQSGSGTDVCAETGRSETASEEKAGATSSQKKGGE